jgi:hypothetical protein
MTGGASMTGPVIASSIHGRVSRRVPALGSYVIDSIPTLAMSRLGGGER